MQTVDKICSVIIMVLGVINAYRIFYIILGLVCRPKTYAATQRRGRYAVVIAARNEEAVVGNLIASIRGQDYDGPQPEIFVVADNCRDSTAQVCREAGARVYERYNTYKARKGYALEFLFEQIKRDYGIGSYDGYFVFDADNLLAPDFVSRMNEAFFAGNKVVTGYRSTKNFDAGIVAASYGIHFFHNSLSVHRPRSVLGLGTHLTGTGYLVASELLADGWHCTTFTEDDQFTMQLASRGVKVAYCEAAEFFDEQPVDMKTSFAQRVRWAKGRLVNFFHLGWRLFAGIFTRASLTDYDLFCSYFPYGLLKWCVELVYPACSLIYGAIHGGYNYTAMLVNVASVIGMQCLYSLAAAALTMAREKKHFHAGAADIVRGLIGYPLFTLLSTPIYLVAIFRRVTWVPIRHSDRRRIGEMFKRSAA